MSAPRKPTLSTRTPTRNEPAPELEQAIRQRAYGLYEKRGRQDGHDWDDWFQAEAELNRQPTKTVAPGRALHL